MIDKAKNESEKNTGTKGEDIIAGRNAVNEALRSGRTIDSLYVVRGQKTGSLTALIAKAKQKDITIKEADAKKLDFMCGNANHQGVVAVAAIKEYADLDDIFQLAQSRGEAPFIILADELEDPYNLGAILRTAECTGAHGVIIPKRLCSWIDLCGWKIFCRCCRVCAGCACNQYGCNRRLIKRERSLDLYNRHERRNMVYFGL